MARSFVLMCARLFINLVFNIITFLFAYLYKSDTRFTGAVYQ